MQYYRLFISHTHLVRDKNSWLKLNSLCLETFAKCEGSNTISTGTARRGEGNSYSCISPITKHTLQIRSAIGLKWDFLSFCPKWHCIINEKSLPQAEMQSLSHRGQCALSQENLYLRLEILFTQEPEPLVFYSCKINKTPRQIRFKGGPREWKWMWNQVCRLGSMRQIRGTVVTHFLSSDTGAMCISGTKRGQRSVCVSMCVFACVCVVLF